MQGFFGICYGNLGNELTKFRFVRIQRAAVILSRFVIVFLSLRALLCHSKRSEES